MLTEANYTYYYSADGNIISDVEAGSAATTAGFTYTGATVQNGAKATGSVAIANVANAAGSVVPAGNYTYNGYGQVTGLPSGSTLTYQAPSATNGSELRR